ncbi:MAG: hypothetical protein PHW69_10085 [Elusimicrobiaceae bacterium]|nr:hypothetical protein [Elusimicrobiaceae bacterium]
MKRAVVFFALALPVFPAGLCASDTPFPEIFCRAGTGLSLRMTELGVLLQYTALDDDDSDTVAYIRGRFGRLNGILADSGGLEQACAVKGFPALFCADGANLVIEFADNGVVVRFEAGNDFSDETIKNIHTAYRSLFGQLAASGGDAGKACRQFGSSRKAGRAGADFIVPRASGDAFSRVKTREEIKEEDSQVGEMISTVDD